MSNIVYIVKEQIDDTNQVIRAIFSTPEGAKEYKMDCIEKELDGNMNLQHVFPIECWAVDHHTKQRHTYNWEIFI